MKDIWQDNTPQPIHLILIISIFLLACNERECLQKHKETKHKNAWIQYVPMGKVNRMIPHPARTYTIEVCDKYKEVK